MRNVFAPSESVVPNTSLLSCFAKPGQWWVGEQVPRHFATILIYNNIKREILCYYEVEPILYPANDGVTGELMLQRCHGCMWLLRRGSLSTHLRASLEAKNGMLWNSYRILSHGSCDAQLSAKWGAEVWATKDACSTRNQNLFSSRNLKQKCLSPTWQCSSLYCTTCLRTIQDKLTRINPMAEWKFMGDFHKIEMKRRLYGFFLLKSLTAAGYICGWFHEAQRLAINPRGGGEYEERNGKNLQKN